MESALYGIYALVVFVSEILLVRCAHSFDFWYVNNSCVNTVRQHFPWSILYIYPYQKKTFRNCYTTILQKQILDKDLQSIMFLPKQTVLSTDKAGIRKISKFGVNFYKPSSRSSTIIRSNGRNWFYWPPLRLVSILKNVKLNLAK